MARARLAKARLDAFFAEIAASDAPAARRVGCAFVNHLLGLDGEMLPHAARSMWRTLISDYLELEPAFDMATAHSVELMGEWPRKRLDGFLEELHAIRHVVDHAVRRAPDASADRNNR
jgi:hypothetical protein